MCQTRDDRMFKLKFSRDIMVNNSSIPTPIQHSHYLSTINLWVGHSWHRPLPALQYHWIRVNLNWPPPYSRSTNRARWHELSYPKFPGIVVERCSREYDIYLLGTLFAPVSKTVSYPGIFQPWKFVVHYHCRRSL